MSRALSQRSSSPATADVVETILAAYSRHAKAKPGVRPTAVYIPRAMEARLDAYYRERDGQPARAMVQAWSGVEKVFWDARGEFRVA